MDNNGHLLGVGRWGTFILNVILLKHLVFDKRHVIVVFVFGDKTISMKVEETSSSLKRA